MSATLSGWHITIRNCYLGGIVHRIVKMKERHYIYWQFLLLSFLPGYCFERLLSHRNEFYTCFTNLVKKEWTVCWSFISVRLNIFIFWKYWTNVGENWCSWAVFKFSISRFCLPNISSLPPPWQVNYVKITLFFYFLRKFSSQRRISLVSNLDELHKFIICNLRFVCYLRTREKKPNSGSVSCTYFHRKVFVCNVTKRVIGVEFDNLRKYYYYYYYYY